MPDATRLWAVVPVKSFRTAKRRMAELLAPDERRQLAKTMLEDVLNRLRNAPGLAGILVVTADDEAASLARERGAVVRREAVERGTNAAVKAAIRGLRDMPSAGLMVVPSDVPQISTVCIEAIAALCRPAGSLVLAPASRDGGTNLFACTPPGLVPSRFGEGSFEAHLEAAAQLGIAPQIWASDHLDLDLDRPEDLESFLALRSNTRTDRLLRDIDVASRFAARREAAACDRTPVEAA
jgi:2-phospho-L-lactate guanylyltransferase